MEIVTSMQKMPATVHRAYLPISRPAEQTMSMPALHGRWSAAQVRALIADSPPNSPRYELIGGQLIVTPAPASLHQVALGVILEVLQPYLRREGVGLPLTSPADLQLKPDDLVQPDVFVVPRGEPVEHEHS